jgi:hypothetical protein
MTRADSVGAPPQVRSITIATVVVLLTACVALRVWRLETLPGINGDEAWYGVQMLTLMDGQAFEWRTPPGNLLNPFFSGLLLLLQLPFAPHFWILRAPAVISTLLAVAAAAIWWTFLSTSLRLVATLLLAALPVTIAYGRFGWDSSQSVLAGVLLISCLMKRRWALAALCFVLAVWVHPTNIFLAPLAFFDFAYERPFNLRTFTTRSAVAVLVVLVAKYLFVPPNVQMTASSMLERVGSLQAWQDFVVGFGRLFSGATSYAYIAGPLSPANQRSHDALFWLLLLAVALFGVRGLFGAANRAPQAHVVGWAAMVLAFFVVAGPDAVAPHFERYALVLVAPTILTFVLLLGYAAEQLSMSRHVVTFGGALAAACLVSVYVNYVDVLATTGSESHRTFRTSTREPKAMALEWIRGRSAARPECSETRIVAEDWWAYWPMRYLAYREPQLTVVMTSDQAVEQFLSSSDSCSYLVGFVGGPFENLMAHRSAQTGREIVHDPLNRPILFVWTHP